MWKAAVKSDDGGVKDLGFFVEQEDAAVAVDQHAWQVAGPQGLRNHPPSHYTGTPCL